jgi:hypothetical protein
MQEVKMKKLILITASVLMVFNLNAAEKISSDDLVKWDLTTAGNIYFHDRNDNKFYVESDCEATFSNFVQANNDSVITFAGRNVVKSSTPLIVHSGSETLSCRIISLAKVQ